MKLLFVHQNLGEFGGAESNIFQTATELVRRGHILGLLYHQSTGRNEESWRQVFAHCYNHLGEGNVEPLETILEKFQPDLIYIHNFADLRTLEGLLASSVPVIRMVHDHALYCLRGYKYNYFTRKPCNRPASLACIFPCLAPLARNRGPGWPIRWASYSQKLRELELNRQCDALIVYSNHLKQELIRNGFDARKIELCVPLRAQRTPGETSSFGPRNLILYAGQIIRGKGVDVLLRALARVQERFECLILGEGNHRDYCERLSARLGLRDRVRFQGYVLPSQLKQFYLDASVFVMSSLWPEPFGMAGPEAMRYGLPVVAFDAGGIKEWLRDGENGFLVPWKDTAAFAARLEQLLRDKSQARRLGINGRRSIEQYEAEPQITRLEQLFFRLLGQSLAPAATDAFLPELISAYD